MRIPEIQKRMTVLAEEMQNLAREMVDLADELKRRKPVKPRAKPSSRKMTPELAQEIRDTAKGFPKMSHAMIAVIHNVNPGRVSEALAGKRS